MPTYNPFVAQKYAIQQEQANSADRLSRAQAGLIGQQTQLAPDEAAARNFATRAGGSASLGQADLLHTNAQLAPGIAASENSLRSAQGQGIFGGLGLQNRELNFRTSPNADITKAINNRFFGTPYAGDPAAIGGGGGNIIGGFQPTPGQTDDFQFSGGNGFSEGTSKVPGHGDGTVDKTPAMLAPGEAVLNRAAAEHLGRDTISLLNAIGAHKMGLTIAPQDTRDDRSMSPQEPAPTQNTKDDRAKEPGYASGTSGVPAPGQTITSGSWIPSGTTSQIRALTGVTGVPRPAPQPKPVPGYAKGTSKVPGKHKGGHEKVNETGGGSPALSPAAAANTPDGSGLSPGIMQALMQMGGMGGAPGGGGGMPPPGASPLSMPMPQLARG